MLNGKVLTANVKDRVAQAVAIRNGLIVAVGSDEQIRKYIRPKTRVIRLKGKTVIPGLIATHCHAVGVARGSLIQPHVELLSVRAVQDWIRKQAADVPRRRWIKVPRSDITRLKERRHPTTAELDAACSTHPVIFTAARKSVFNSLGWKTIGVLKQTDSIPGAKIIRDATGKPRLLSGGNAHLRKLMPVPSISEERLIAALRNVHRHYNAVGITSIFERAATPDQFRLYQRLHKKFGLTVRTTFTFRKQFRTAKQVEEYTRTLGMKTGDGDDWMRVGPLKISVDGGIHWGNTRLREPYGPRRIRFYALDDPQYRGDLFYSVERMKQVFAAGHRLGWQMCCHVTGDAGVDRVLDALTAVNKTIPLAQRRFTLVHAYFPAADSIRRAKRLGVCVDTQSSLYYKDSAAIDEIYGRSWAERFIGLGDWIRGGIPVAINGDHMTGLDPNRSMNAYNPFLMLYVAVTRKNRAGRVFGPRQKLTRLQALACVTRTAAYLSFDEKKKGTIEPGRLADLVVLDRDYLTCPEDEIRKIRVLTTILAGKVVYQRNAESGK
ncbi:MAG: amidohydrolase [Planctomycetes bacterium]|nr:amidohydrolase [Planctomycetota bacterium]